MAVATGSHYDVASVQTQGNSTTHGAGTLTMTQYPNQYNDDDNWYLRDFDKPKKSSGAWLSNPWVLIALLGATSLVLLVVVAFIRNSNINQRQAAGPFEFPAPIPPQVVEKKLPVVDPVVAERQRRARDAFAFKGAFRDISPEEQESVKAFVPRVLDAFHGAPETEFQKLVDVPEFRRRVRSSRSLTVDAIVGFENEFDKWLIVFPPFRSDVTRMELANIQREASDGTLRVYLWVYRSLYPERCVLHLTAQDGAFRIVDFEHLEDSILLSDGTARKFSAAFEDVRWENFEKSIAVRKKILLADEDIEQRKQMLRDISTLDLPPTVAELELQRIAAIALDLDDDELFLHLADRLEQGNPAPAIKWYRAMQAIKVKDYPRAIQMIDDFTRQLGEGLDTLRVRADIAEAMEDTEAANNCWLQILAADPQTYVSWNFFESAKSDDVTRLAALIPEYGDVEKRAATIALQFVQRDRLDLVRILLPLAEAAGKPTAALMELRAAMHEMEGDPIAQKNELHEAWTSLPTDDPERTRIFNLYAIALQEQDLGDEAIRLSDDPGSTFHMLSMDGYGVLNVPLSELKQYVATLETATAESEEANANLAFWKRLAPLTLAHEEHQYDRAWKLATEILTPDTGSDSSRMLEMLEEKELRWLVDEYLTTAAVRLGYIEEAWNLHGPDFRLQSFLGKLVSTEASADKFRLLAALVKQDTEADPRDLQFCEARALWAEKNVDGCRKLVCAILQVPGEESSSTVFLASSLLTQILLAEKDLRPLLPEVPPGVIQQLINALIYRERLEDAQMVFDYAAGLINAPADLETIRLQLLAERKEWHAISVEGVKWLEQQAPVENEQLWSETSRVDYFLRAFLEISDFANARALTERMLDHWKLKNWKFQLAVACNDQQLAELLINESEFWTADPGPMMSRYCSDEWREFRLRHPRSLSDVLDSRTYAPWSLLLSSEPLQISADSLTTTLKPLLPDAQVRDVSEALKYAELEAITSLKPGTGADLKTNPVPSGRQCFQITTGELMLLVMASAKPLEGYEGRFPAPAIRITANEDATQQALETAVAAHQSWIDVKIHSASNGDETAKAEKIQKQVLGALMADSVSVAVGDEGIVEVTDDIRTAFRSGSTDSVKAAAAVRSVESIELFRKLHGRNRVALYSLQSRLQSLPEGMEVPPIQLLVVQTGSNGNDDLPIALPLKQWKFDGSRRQFVVDTTNCPWIPPAQRGEPLTVSTWQILGYVEK